MAIGARDRGAQGLQNQKTSLEKRLKKYWRNVTLGRFYLFARDYQNWINK